MQHVSSDAPDPTAEWRALSLVRRHCAFPRPLFPLDLEKLRPLIALKLRNGGGGESTLFSPKHHLINKPLTDSATKWESLNAIRLDGSASHLKAFKMRQKFYEAAFS